MCYASFENSDLLTQHFTTVHDDSSSTSSSYNPYENNVSSVDMASNSVTPLNPVVESVNKKHIFDLN